MRNNRNLSRRDFLKLLGLLGLSMTGFRTFGGNQTLPSPEQDEGLKPRPNILLLVFDTLSARHLSLLGYPRQTTPNLARFAGRATVFHRHYAGGNYTVPGTASLLTGVYPWLHRALHLFGTVRDSYAGRNIFSALAENYHISAFTHNPHVLGLLNQFKEHLDQLTPPKDLAILAEPLTDRLLPEDFPVAYLGERVIRGSGADLPGSLFLSFLEKDLDTYTPEELKRRYGALFPRGVPNNSLGVFFLLEHAIDWIQDQVTNAPHPFFHYFHLLPPHEPYMARKEFIDLFADNWAPRPKPVLAFPQRHDEAQLHRQRRYYDEYLAYVDAEFGRLYDFLERDGTLENTYFIVTSDHGQLFERKIHGHYTSTLYEPLIRVPLLISKPGQSERQDVFTSTSCVDLLPTVLQIAGKPIPEPVEGRVLPTFGTETRGADRDIYVVEAKTNLKLAPLRTGTLAIIQGRHKLIHYFGYSSRKDGYELYDLENDPEELENLYPSRGTTASALRAELKGKLIEMNRPFSA